MILTTPEYYRLICCDTCEPLQINKKDTLFLFTGDSYNDLIPDYFMDNVVGEIVTASNLKIKGCYRLELIDENCDTEMFQIINWKLFFKSATCFKTCEECLPVVIPEERIYIERLIPIKPKDECYNQIMAFVSAMYSDALKRLEGISLCCTPDSKRVIAEYKMIKMGRLIDRHACCPPCVAVDIFIPAGSIGEYVYNDCNGDAIIVPVNVLVDTIQRICICTKTFSQIIYTGTGTGFLATPLGIPCS